MSSVSGIRESSSISTVTCHVPSSACSSDVTASASRPVIAASSSRARFAICAPGELLRLRSSSAIAIALLRRLTFVGRRLRPRDLLLEDLALGLGGLFLADLAALVLLLEFLDLLHARCRTVLLAIYLLADLVSHPNGEPQRRRGQ